ncbi:MAG: 4Fe-4S binding protein [Promethearchaeota archaeon]|jgi:polyferredoxin
MINQNFDESVQILYFPHFGNLILIVLSFIILISVGLLAGFLIRKQRLTSKLKMILLAISFIFGGIILGGVPNVVLVIQHIFADFLFPSRWLFLVLRISIFLGLTLIFGRIFCGYVCPLGVIQELASMIRFKPKLDYGRTYKKRRDFLRWGFFVVYAISSMIFGLYATLFMNPINGFLIFWTTFKVTILIAFVIFIATIILGVFIYRSYCRFFCPFGALAALLGRLSPLKIRRTKYCNECGICEKICPTLEGFEYSAKGECYYCNRCLDFCTNEMFIDNAKIAQINRLLTTSSLDIDVISKEKFFDNIMKSIIRLLIPYKRNRVFEEFTDALQGKKDMFIDAIQNIVIRLKAIFPDEIEHLDISKYRSWIELNETRWKNKIEPVNLDKLFYGLAKETQ